MSTLALPKGCDTLDGMRPDFLVSSCTYFQPDKMKPYEKKTTCISLVTVFLFGSTLEHVTH